MANSMEHWNGAQICAIDTETTGLVAGYHEIVQICVLPLDSNLNVRKDKMPFNIFINPEHHDRIDPKAMAINKIKDLEKGLNPEDALDLLLGWVDKLGLPYTNYGTRKRVIPLGQNYQFDRGFISHWMGRALYEETFNYNYRDTQIAAGYLNDRAACHSQVVPFPKINLRYLASQLKIPSIGSHDALADCVMTAKVYQRMVRQGLLG